MASLKAFLPQLAKVVDMTPDALYSRQRALTNMGVLKSIEGRGPGSGVTLSGESVAVLIIALMAADSLQDTDERVRRTCNAEAEEAGVKPLQPTLAAILLSAESVKKFQVLTINRNETATILYREGQMTRFAKFNIRKTRGNRSVININATMAAEPIRQISKALLTTLGDPA
jgi:hypothetical protein